MEVHPPEHGIHSWRDFLVHMGTITVGLLIALGLEGLVEVIHHRHLVHTARETLHAEVEANVATLREDTRFLDTTHRNLLADLQTLRQLGANPDKAKARLVSDWTWHGLHDSAYNTAKETGALSLMPYQEVQHIDAVFTQQHYVDRAADSYIRDVTSIAAPLQGHRSLAEASPRDIQSMVDGCSASLIDIELLQAFMRGLADDYRNFSTK